ncbi:MAG: HrpE/YscL family type III secretion apparatus protein [Chlamydiales bacterium]
MKFFSLINKDKTIGPAPQKKVIPAHEFSDLIAASDLLKKVKKDEELYRISVGKECERLKEEAELAGFEEGLKQWNAKLRLLEQEIKEVRKEMQETIVPLSITAVKKIIGRELKSKPETIVDIVSTAVKAVSQHRRVSIYVNKGDLDLIESKRPQIKDLFEHIETLSIEARSDVAPGGCIIVTEAGIMNAQLESQLKALETTFTLFFQNQKNKRTG